MFIYVRVLMMMDLKQAITDVADFPRPGILFWDITPLLRDHFDATVQALDALLTEQEWSSIDALAGIESRGFILGAALAIRRRKGFVLVRKQGNCRRRWWTWPMISNMDPAFWKCNAVRAG